MAVQRFDVHSLAVILPVVVLVTLGLTMAVLNLTYNSYHETKDNVEVKAWWDGDHADIYVKINSKKLLPATIKIKEYVEEKKVYQPSKHILCSLTVDSTDKPLLVTGAVTAKNFEVEVLTPQKNLVFKVRLR